ncbi:MAG TPA: hypothetical protein VEV17_01525 [Bryobacteraceae bacterium]|nr:hypothetical protein [Bryobacteraceae bacterium]
MRFEWFATEHYRLHSVEEWPDGPHKEVALSAIRSSLASLTRNLPSGVKLPGCEVCLSRKHASGVVPFPSGIRQDGDVGTDLAA